MELINKYLHEVTRRLSPKIQEDVSLEIESAIKDMLPEDYTEEDVKEVLTEFGDPSKLARQYRDKPSFVFGQQVYDFFISSLNVFGFILLIIALVLLVTGTAGLISGETEVFSVLLSISIELIGAVFNIWAHVFFWVMLLFILLEGFGVYRDGKSSPLTGKPWTPEDLQHVMSIPLKKSLSKLEVFVSIIWAIIATTFYFVAAGLIDLLAITIFNEEMLLSYLPFVILLFCMNIGLNIYMLFLGKWTMNLFRFYTLYHAGLAVFLVIIASQQHLFNMVFITNFAEKLNLTFQQLEMFSYIFLWVIIITVLAYVIYDTMSGFRKARIKPN